MTSWRRAVPAAAVLVLLAGLAAAWSITPLHRWLDPGRFAAWAEPWRQDPAAPLYVIGIYVAAGLVVMPVTFLIVSTALVFGSLRGWLYALAGCLASATVGYLLGWGVGHDVVRQLAGSRIERISRRLAQHGILTMAVARLLPLGPFTIVNLVVGASHIRMLDFLVGSALGLTPAILAMGVFADRLRELAADPGLRSFALVLACGLTLVLGGAWVRRRFDRPDPAGSSPSPPPQQEVPRP